MSEFSNKNQFRFSWLSFRSYMSPAMQFDPIPVEDDELIQAIENERQDRDNSWLLEERPDPERLEAFWRSAVEEL